MEYENRQLQTILEAHTIVQCKDARKRFIALLGIQASMLAPYRILIEHSYEMDVAFVYYKQEVNYVRHVFKINMVAAVVRDSTNIHARLFF